MEVVDFFRQPEKFRTSGAKAPKGVLLVGPPGNGKTLMARAVAGESGVAFISSSASEFIEMYMGLGAARVRDLFNTVRGRGVDGRFVFFGVEGLRFGGWFGGVMEPG